MKRIKSFAAIVAASLTLASCGFGTTGQTANGTGTAAQTDALGSILGGAAGQAGAGILGTILGNILGGTTTQQSLVGSWTYAGPKLVFESENVLSQIGGQVLSNNIEQKLGTYLEKMGFKAGKSVRQLLLRSWFKDFAWNLLLRPEDQQVDIEWPLRYRPIALHRYCAERPAPDALRR